MKKQEKNKKYRKFEIECFSKLFKLTQLDCLKFSAATSQNQECYEPLAARRVLSICGAYSTLVGPSHHGVFDTAECGTQKITNRR